MKTWIWIGFAMIIGSFIACDNGGNPPATNSVRNTCQVGQLYSATHNLCLNSSGCPSGQGYLPSENKCVPGELISQNPTQNGAIGNFVYRGGLTVTAPLEYQKMLRTYGVCDTGAIQWCWPNPCPSCETWTSGSVNLQTYQDMPDRASLWVQPIANAPYYAYSSPVGGLAQISGTQGQGDKMTFTYTHPYTMQPMILKLDRASLGQAQINAELLFQNAQLGTIILIRN